jgi:SAM-dependent methyltransferase
MREAHRNDVVHRSKNLAKYRHPNLVYRYLTRRLHRALLDLLAQARPRTVLEAGCGEGFVLRYIDERQPGYRLTGLDLSTGAIDYARLHCHPSVGLLVGDVTRLPFKSRSFDAVICSEVLEHLPNVQAALDELARVGLSFVLISVPREPYFRICARLTELLRLGEDPEHVAFWTRRGFARLVCERFIPLRITVSTIYRLAACRIAVR